ncbi:MAG: hypothetical protein ACYCO9_16515 [Streptosporangiaceae bacterium]
MALGGGAAGTGTASDPWSAVGAGGSTGYYLAGPVAPQIIRIGLTLSDGQRLTLVPVEHAARAHGKVTPWTGVVLPRQLTITKVVAYSRHGVLAYAIPFSGHGMDSAIQNWLRPGQKVPGRFTRRIGADAIGGHHWSVTVYAGPWGACAFADITGGTGYNAAGRRVAGRSGIPGWAKS